MKQKMKYFGVYTLGCFAGSAGAVIWLIWQNSKIKPIDPIT